MKLYIIVIALFLSAYALAQELEQFDTFLIRNKSDLVKQATEEKLSEISHLLGLEIIEMRSYQSSGSTNYYLHTFHVAGSNASLVYPNLYPEMNYHEALVTFREFMPQKVVGSPDGIEALIYVAGFSANNGSSLGCIIPAKNENTFIHVTANSDAFLKGTDFDNFDLEFRNLVESLLEKMDKRKTAEPIK